MNLGISNGSSDTSFERLETLDRHITRKDRYGFAINTVGYILLNCFTMFFLVVITRNYFDGMYVYITLLIVSLLLGINFLISYLIPVLLYQFDHRRHYTVFNVQSSFNDESQFSLSDLRSLFIQKGIAKRPVEGSSFVDERILSPSAAENELQLNKFQMKRKRFSLRKILNEPTFVVSPYTRKDTTNTFLFYSRNKSTWNNILNYLEANDLRVNVLNSEKIHV